MPDSKEVARTRRSRRTGPAFAAILTAALAQMLLAPDASAKEGHRIVAASGDPAPEGGTFLRFLGLATNERGEVAFHALLLGSSQAGIFAWNGRTTSAIALAGNPDPASGDFAFVDAPVIDSRGDVVFNADAGIFRAGNGGLDPIMRDGESAPGGGTLVGPAFSFSATPHGTVAFLTGTAGTGSTQGIFLRTGRKTVAIARDADPSPIGGTFLFLGDPVVGGGQVSFYAGTEGASGDFGIFRGDAEGRVSAIFAANQIAPSGALFEDFGNPVINARGQVAAVGVLANGPARAGLFRSDGDRIAVLAIDGARAPAGGDFTASFLEPLALNDRGEAAFLVRLANGPGTIGLFRGDGQTTTTVALLGTPAPGTTGTFSAFGDLKLLDDGTVAFVGRLARGTGGVDRTNDAGIWVGTSERDLRLVVRTGDVVEGRPLLSVPGRFGLLGASRRSLAWVAGFAANATAVVVSDIGDAERAP